MRYHHTAFQGREGYFKIEEDTQVQLLIDGLKSSSSFRGVPYECEVLYSLKAYLKSLSIIKMDMLDCGTQYAHPDSASIPVTIAGHSIEISIVTTSKRQFVVPY